jgi:hypothetical protein
VYLENSDSSLFVFNVESFQLAIYSCIIILSRTGKLYIVRWRIASFIRRVTIPGNVNKMLGYKVKITVLFFLFLFMSIVSHTGKLYVVRWTVSSFIRRVPIPSNINKMQTKIYVCMLVSQFLKIIWMQFRSQDISGGILYWGIYKVWHHKLKNKSL